MGIGANGAHGLTAQEPADNRVGRADGLVTTPHLRVTANIAHSMAASAKRRKFVAHSTVELAVHHLDEENMITNPRLSKRHMRCISDNFCINRPLNCPNWTVCAFSITTHNSRKQAQILQYSTSKIAKLIKTSNFNTESL